MTARSQLSSLLLLVLISLVYVLLYGATWLDMERVWRSSATYNHCYLIIPISLYFFYRAKATAAAASTAEYWLWLPAIILLGTQLVWLIGYAADVALLMHLATIVTLQALLWLMLGNDLSRRYIFAIGYLIFLVPFGDELSPFLQNTTADFTVQLLHMVNIPIYREGLYLATPVGLFEVAEACSGLRFLIASLAISVLFAYLNFNKLWKQISFVGFMALLSILANGVRAFMLVYIGEKTGMRFGFGADHYLYGWLFFGVVLLGGFWLGARFADHPVPLSRTIKRDFSLQPVSAAAIFGITTVLLTLGYSQSLNVHTTPATAASISLPFTLPATDSNWGITFVHSLAQVHGADEAGTEYFIALYANKQQSGELINWQNHLFDKASWQIQQHIATADNGILQLKNRASEYRTVLYWYQVNEHKMVNTLETKLHQALSFLADDNSEARIYAVSVSGIASEQNLAVLHNAAAKLSQAEPGPIDKLAGLTDD